MNRIVPGIAVLASLALSQGACVRATDFRGDAHFPGGPQGCRAACDKQSMEMSAYVYSGEFASSCVCRPAGPRAAKSARQDGDGIAVSAAVGVVNQMRREEEEEDEQRRREEQEEQQGQREEQEQQQQQSDATAAQPSP